MDDGWYCIIGMMCFRYVSGVSAVDTIQKARRNQNDKKASSRPYRSDHANA